jgi:hypothetical protein
MKISSMFVITPGLPEYQNLTAWRILSGKPGTSIEKILLAFLISPPIAQIG